MLGVLSAETKYNRDTSALFTITSGICAEHIYEGGFYAELCRSMWVVRHMFYVERVRILVVMEVDDIRSEMEEL